MRDKTVGDCMTPVESVFMLDVDGVIDQEAMNEVLWHQAHPAIISDQQSVGGFIDPLFPELVGLVWLVRVIVSYS